MHDAITAEKAGIAATVVITDRFTQTAHAMAQASRTPGFPFAVIPHPISNNSGDVLRTKAEDAVQQCIKILLERSL